MNTKEIDRLIDDINHAVKSSSLLPLLRQQQQHRQRHRRRNTQRATTVKAGTTEKAAAAAAATADTYVSQATLDEQLLLIRQVLELSLIHI